MIDHAQFGNSIDLVVRGVVRVRLLDATPRDVDAVARQIGAERGEIGDVTDITIRFVEQHDTTSDICYLGLNDVAYDRNEFYVIRDKRMLRIPFEHIGRPCEVVCQRGRQSLALLSQIVNLTALRSGTLALHGAAFRYQDTNCLAIGWPRGGKTAALLASLDSGAEYIAAEWVFLGDEGRKMNGAAESIRVRNWHLKSMPEYRSRIGVGDRLRLQSLAWLTRSIEYAGKILPSRLVERLIRMQKQQLYIDVPAEDLIGSSVIPQTASLDKVLFVIKHNAPETVIRPIGTDELVQRLALMHQEERAGLMTYYRKFRFAFPNSRNEFLESADQLEFDLLQRSLAGKSAYMLYHPYDASLHSLAEAISSVCEDSCSP